ncbi:MAG TPA: hypothetical protein VGF98_00495 [Candidatus Tumulicola sp.]|jgi:hypothetical protein
MNGTLEKVALNTQPIPPGVAFYSDVAKAAIARAWTLYDVQTGLAKGADNDGDWLPVNFIHSLGDNISLEVVYRFIHPLHPNWFGQEMRAIDYLTVSAELETAAAVTSVPSMRAAFRQAANRLQQRAIQRGAE